jgi:ADP-heptose:LPS heptosyltransferase
MKVETLGDEFDAGPDAFLDTAAVMQHLDLVIAPNTAITHLAGALARPLLVPLDSNSDWRWFTARADSPWYPTAQLFRQSSPGDWGSVFAAIADHVSSRLA